MGLGTLNNRSAGQTILDTFFNDIHSALNGSFVGRNTSGVPTSGQDLGTVAIPWGSVRATGLVLNGESVDTSQIVSPPNRVISGKTRSTSNQPAFITPTGSAASFTIFASTTSLVLDINGSNVSVATDIATTGLTVAASSQNTCLIDDTDAADQVDTRRWGTPNHRKSIAVDTMGTNITALVGKFATFKHGSEYFMAYVESSVKLSKALRGFFYDSSLNPINADVFSNNDTVTLMSTGWVFVEDNGTTVDVSYLPPSWSQASPTSPATGQYWYDLDNQVWKRYDGATFQIIDRTLVGIVIIDATNCVAARCIHFYGNFRPDNTLDVEIQSTEIVRGTRPLSKVNVAGRSVEFRHTLPLWNITTDLANSVDMYNATEQASTYYYLYLTDEGDTVISDIEPYNDYDRMGLYHPHNPWRCVGDFFNSSGSNITRAESEADRKFEMILSTGSGRGSTATYIRQLSGTISYVGTSWDFAGNSTANGVIVTCRRAGWYTVRRADRRSAGGTTAGISLNATTAESAGSISSLADAKILSVMGTAGAMFNTFGDITRYFNIGDVVKPHDSSTSDLDDTSTSVRFQITPTSGARPVA